MADLKPQASSPAERVTDLVKIQEALHRGVREALRRHKQARNPVATWRDGKVVWVAPEDIPVDDDEPPAER
jgi:hypothetical protein